MNSEMKTESAPRANGAAPRMVHTISPNKTLTFMVMRNLTIGGADWKQIADVHPAVTQKSTTNAPTTGVIPPNESGGDAGPAEAGAPYPAGPTHWVWSSAFRRL